MIQGCRREGEAAARGGGRGAGRRQRQVIGGCRQNRQWDRGGERVGRVGDGQGLRAGLRQRHGEGALAVRQRRVHREPHRARGIAAGEVDGAAVGGDRVALGILRGDGHADGLPGGDGRGNCQLEVMNDGRTVDKGVQDVRRGLLDAGIDDVVPTIVVQCPAPGGGAGIKDPCPAGRLVDRRVGGLRAGAAGEGRRR